LLDKGPCKCAGLFLCLFVGNSADVNAIKMDLTNLAKDLYTAYSEGVGGVSFNGDKLPTADEFFNDITKQKQINAWLKAAMVVGEKLFKVTQNLGHPAYGHSSATSIGIDELRNQMFDYLGVPQDLTN
jgi:hypothetical protein